MRTLQVTLAVLALAAASLLVTGEAHAQGGWRAYHRSTWYGSPYARTRLVPNTTAVYPYAFKGAYYWPREPYGNYYPYHIDPTPDITIQGIGPGIP